MRLCFSYFVFSFPIEIMNKTKENKKELNLDFKGLEFEEVLADLLQIKPIENEDLKKDIPKNMKMRISQIPK